MIDATRLTIDELREIQDRKARGYSGHAWAGDRYAQGRDVADVAKLIRADIKAAVKAGDLPPARYSVRISRYSGGCSLDIRVSGAPVLVPNPAWVKANLDHPHVCPDVACVTDEWAEIEKRLERIGNRYRRSDVDSQSDYFNVSFWLGVSADWEWKREQEQQVKALLLQGLMPKPKSWAASPR